MAKRLHSTNLLVGLHWLVENNCFPGLQLSIVAFHGKSGWIKHTKITELQRTLEKGRRGGIGIPICWTYKKNIAFLSGGGFFAYNPKPHFIYGKMFFFQTPHFQNKKPMSLSWHSWHSWCIRYPTSPFYRPHPPQWHTMKGWSSRPQLHVFLEFSPGISL